MRIALPFCLAAALAVVPSFYAQADSPVAGTKQGCFFEADFLEKRIKGDTREARAAEARRWYIRRLVAGVLENHRQANAISPVPENFRGS